MGGGGGGEDDELPEELVQAGKFYQADLPHAIMLPVKYQMWVTKWKVPGCNTLEKLVDAFKVCDAISSPNIKFLLYFLL